MFQTHENFQMLTIHDIHFEEGTLCVTYIQHQPKIFEISIENSVF